jgi:rfaE bifunctional protein kinase chain/domain
MLVDKITFVSGIFNVLHPGHLRLLRYAKSLGGRLVVGVLSDHLAKGSAHVSEDLRLEGLRSVSLIDDVVLVSESLKKTITELRPDFVVKGSEHEDRHNAEKDLVSAYGGQLVFSSGESVFSSLDLLRREVSIFDPRTISFPRDYAGRHRIKIDNLEKIIKGFRDIKVCVVGDLIVDEYITCEALGMSQEDPTIVVSPVDTKRFIGGAGIVGAHAASLGATVSLVSVSGNDSARTFAIEELEKLGVSCHISIDKARPTTLKQRFRSQGKTLLRVSHLSQSAISTPLQRRLYAAIEESLAGAELLVFSDFNYGCLPQALVDKIVLYARQKDILMVADSQSSSQTGDISRFRGMDLITPTEREARVSTRNREDGLVILARKLHEQSGAKNVLLKLGSEGVLIQADSSRLAPGEKVDESGWLTDRIEALNSAAKDVAGAGDSLLITSAMALAGGAHIWEAACLGSLAAAVQVGRVGNSPLKVPELMSELTA